MNLVFVRRLFVWTFVMKPLGKSNINLTMLFEYVKQFTGETVKKTDKLLDYNLALSKHLTYSFITVCKENDILLILQNYYLHVLTIEEVSSDHLVIITGNVDNWKHAIETTFLNKVKSHRVSQMMEQAFNYFKNDEGFGYLWNEYNKTREHGALKFIEKR